MAMTRQDEDELQLCIQKFLSEKFPYSRPSHISMAAQRGLYSTLGQLRYLNKHSMPGIGSTNFLDLPAETRNRIYEYTVTKEPGKVIFIGNETCGIHAWMRQLITAGTGFLPRPPSITQVCRQLRQETISLYFFFNTFATSLDSAENFEILRKWLKTCDQESVQHIKKFRVYLQVRSYPPRDPNTKSDDVSAVLKSGGVDLDEDDLELVTIK